MLRVVSLLPAATEIVCAVGASGSLVGISHECDHPLEIIDLPRVTRRPAGAPDKTTDPLDLLAPFELDLPLLARLQPDLIITQDLCSVCAVDFSTVTARLAQAGLEAAVVRLHPRRLDDLFDNIEAIGNALGVRATASELVGGLRRRVAEVDGRARAAGDPPQVLTIEWIDPLMQGGYWTPDLVAAAGGIPILGSAGEPSRQLTADELEASSPDVVVVKPCGLTLERALTDLRLFRAAVPWRRWPAVKSGRVYFADGNSWFNRPGPRLIDSIEVLAACFHPQPFRDFRRAYGYGIARITQDLLIERW